MVYGNTNNVSKIEALDLDLELRMRNLVFGLSWEKGDLL